MKYFMLHTTIDDAERATQLSQHAVESRLAACVHILPVQSVYQWKGNLETANEFRCELKTREDCLPDLRRLLEDLHSYDVPEMLEIELQGLSPSYQAWIDEQLAPA